MREGRKGYLEKQIHKPHSVLQLLHVFPGMSPASAPGSSPLPIGK